MRIFIIVTIFQISSSAALGQNAIFNDVDFDNNDCERLLILAKNYAKNAIWGIDSGTYEMSAAEHEISLASNLLNIYSSLCSE